MSGSSATRRTGAFTLVELLVVMGVFGMFAAGLMAVWSSLSITAVNTTAYSRLQNDHMRVLDYMKRDIHRAAKVELIKDGAVVTDTGTFASELHLTIPDYYADARQEDDSLGAKAAHAPVLQGEDVAYGAPLLVRFYCFEGTGIRREGEISRPLADAAGAFEFSFKRESTGAIRCRVAFDQPSRGFSRSVIRRTVETVCVPRLEFK